MFPFSDKLIIIIIIILLITLLSLIARAYGPWRFPSWFIKVCEAFKILMKNKYHLIHIYLILNILISILV
jgi:hypothetical protein